MTNVGQFGFGSIHPMPVKITFCSDFGSIRVNSGFGLAIFGPLTFLCSNRFSRSNFASSIHKQHTTQETET